MFIVALFTIDIYRKHPNVHQLINAKTLCSFIMDIIQPLINSDTCYNVNLNLKNFMLNERS